MPAREVNFDGLVGPTHNYAGLSFGNLASKKHGQQKSNPRAAALQGLEKMKLVHDLGIGQAVLPPLRRPNSTLLGKIGFEGTDKQRLDSAWKEDPILAASCFSASNMWTANSATVSPSADCSDKKVHLTPANLSSGLHRSIEAMETTQVLRAVFNDSNHFVVHDPLPGSSAFADEGAANHTRLCGSFDGPGIEMFVFGRSALDKSIRGPREFPARQTLEASQAVVRLHRIDPANTVLVQQTPEAIDAGVFHNDVISVGNQNVLLFHECSFVNSRGVLEQLENLSDKQGWRLHSVGLTRDELPLEDAVKSYLFNSQILTRPDGRMTLLCPLDARELSTSYECTRRILAEDNPIDKVEFLDLRQSMNNGGGPACLRLRVLLTENELASVHQSVLFSNELYEALAGWVNKHYREELSPDDLRDPQLIGEVDDAFHELKSILNLPGSIFRFGS